MQTVGIASLAFAMAALPLSATLRFRRRGILLWDRPALAGLAAATTVAALVGLDGAAQSLLSAHMLQHVVLGDIVPLLLVFSVRRPLLDQLLPAPALRLIRRLGVADALAFATRPPVAFVFWAGAMAVWHIPAVYDRALASEPLHAFEHATFLAAGVLVWFILLDPAGRGALGGWRRFAYALALLAASGALANTLILSYRPLYPSYAHAAANRLGLTPVGDQDLAGLLMMLEQLATVGSFAILSARRQLHASDAEGPRRHPLAA